MTIQERMGYALSSALTYDEIKELCELKRVNFIFKAPEAICNYAVEFLQLSLRTLNGLRRAKIDTVGDLVNTIKTFDDVLNLPQIGEKSAREIMYALFLVYYDLLKDEYKADYVRTMYDINCSLSEADRFALLRVYM